VAVSFFLPGLLAGSLLGSLGLWLVQRARKVAPLQGQLEPALLRAEVSAALARPASLRSLLQPCAEAMVRHLGAVFARIWVLPPGGDSLELQASAGLYTHLDGPHSRVRVGELKIGLIAQERRPHLSQDVLTDPRVADKEWARRERMVSFAGYPLIAEGQVVGVMALFSRERLGVETLETLASVADAVAQGIARKRAEEALRHSEERFRLLLDSTGEGIYGMDPRGRCTFANRSCARLLGYEDASRLIGLDMHHVFHHSREDGTPIPPEACAIYKGMLREEGSHSDTEWLWRRDGTGFPAEVWSFPLKQGGELLGMVVTFVDVTGRRRAEAERARLLQEAREAIRARDDFLAIASHELRTPLTPLRLGLQRTQKLLQAPGYSDAELRERLATVDRQVVRINRLVDSLLDLSRLQRGTLQLQTERLDLAALVREVVERSREVLVQSGCEALLDASEPVWVSADRLRMEQVVENLLSNAVKYGAGQPVGVRCVADEGLARLSVQDRGIGIAPEDQKRIFERFERASSVRHYGGFGLGLFILREIVEAHGGRVSVQSQPGTGATFTVVLPLVS
jgi:PAS domain S-box-containing protein